jgi:hypothetical protein
MFKVAVFSVGCIATAIAAASILVIILH